ncbi:CDP-alcohol phosphatidyltransferase family protein [candidate division KSB1 bacterium]|nr:CDP-alcohol phosphatidyltransferase family protein [candidate division KSB1 bacterium]
MIKEFIETPRLEKWVGRTFSFLSPNTWTTVSLVIAVLAFALVISGRIFVGVSLFIFSTLCDLIDGKVARFSNRSSTLGAFWDGTVDRFVDSLLIACFFFLPLERDPMLIGLLLFLLLFTTLLPPFIVAYANHRGAVPDPTEKVIWRIAYRVEYLVPYIAAISVYPINPAFSYYLLWFNLIMMGTTVLQSIYMVFIKAKNYS